MKDANEREGLAGIEAAGGGDVFLTLTLSWVNIADKFALGPGIEGKLKVKDGIENWLSQVKVVWVSSKAVRLPGGFPSSRLDGFPSPIRVRLQQRYRRVPTMAYPMVCR